MADRKDDEISNPQTKADIKRIKSLMWEMGQPRGEWKRPPGSKDTIHHRDEPEVFNYSKGGQVGRVGAFGMHRSKPDFAGGGARTNMKFNFKKGDR